MGRKKCHSGDILKGIRYDFSVNLNPLGTPESIREAMSAPGSITSYPDPECRLLRKELSERYGISADNIACGNGVSDIIHRICASCGFKRVLLAVPSFTIYEDAFTEKSIEYTFIHTGEESGFVLNGEYLSFGNDYDAIFTADPVNPSGAVMSSDELNRLREWCEETDTVLVIDESYIELVDPEIFEDYESSGSDPVTIVIRSLTKTFAMAGAGMGFAFFSDARMAAAVSASGAPWSVPGVVQSAASAALEEQQFVERSIGYIRREREYLTDSFREMGITCFDSVSNYILFEGSTTLGAALHEEGFLVRDCSDYEGLADSGNRRFYRAAVKIHRDNTLLVEALKACLKRERKPVSIMLQGTVSGAGKSMIASGLCRIFEQDGLRAAGFSADDVSGAFAYIKDVKSAVSAEYERLAEENDIVVIEGFGNPAEPDADKDDIRNMGLAALTDSPVILVGDMERGGAAAQVAGTLMLMSPESRERVKGVIINRCVNDEQRSEEYRQLLEIICGCDVLGILPLIAGESGQKEPVREKYRDFRNVTEPVDSWVNFSSDGELLVYSWLDEEYEEPASEYINRMFRRGNGTGRGGKTEASEAGVRITDDVAADLLRTCLDIPGIYRIMGIESPHSRKSPSEMY